MPSFKCNRKTFSDQGDFIRRGYRCATSIPTDLEIERTKNEIGSLRRSLERAGNIAINVQFIHITSGNNGQITEDQRVEQIKVLNSAFSTTGIRFTYIPSNVVTVNRPGWFYMGKDSAEEREAKTALHVPPEYNLNFYTAELQAGTLGWARLPWRLAGDRIMDGAVILHSSLPGGTEEPYNLGQTATHEIGHWLGLLHTFERGCRGNGDEVDDTESHSEPNYGCGDTLRGTDNYCQGETQSPIKNYMNYVDDSCMSEFTNGQINRMKDMITTYRTGLLIGPDSIPVPI